MKVTHEPLGSLPPKIIREFESIGPVWGSDITKHRDIVIAAYTPLVAAAPKDGISVHRDLPYASHPRQVLDVFVPIPVRSSSDGEGVDVVVFAHGGAFVRGSKSINGQIYDNVPYWFARQGCVAVNLEYRLANEAPYPGGAEDLASAVAWIKGNIGRFGGSPRRVFLMGHSAGGTHAATLLFDPLFRGNESGDVAGAVLVSARLQADVLPDNPNAHGVRAYFGEDQSLYETRAPGNHPNGSQVPLMIVTAQFDNPYLDLYGARFFHDVGRARGSMSRFIQMPKHNHTSLVAHFDSGEEYLGREILRFIVSVPGSGRDDTRSKNTRERAA